MHFSIVFICVLTVSIADVIEKEDELLSGSGEELPIINVEIVSGREFDPLNNEANQKTLNNAIDDYSKSQDIKYPSERIHQTILNHGGKFAVNFEIHDARCDEVHRFIDGAKNHTTEFVYAVLKCLNEPTQII